MSTWTDELLALDAVAFLVACSLAYLALRAGKERHKARVEKVADAIFLLGLFMMVVICGLLAYEFI